MSRVKIAEKTVFFVFFQNFFEFWAKIFQTFGQKTSKSFQNYLRVQRNSLWLGFFLSFQTFRIFCRNLRHGSQISIYVSRVKIAEKTVFFVFFQNFFEFWAKIFHTFGQKTSKSFQNYLRVQRNSLWLGFFLSFQTFRIFCRNIWHGSQNSIYVSRVKIAEKTVFFCFLSRIFSNFEQKFFRLLAKKLQKVFKTTYVSRGIVCSLKFFSKVLNRFGFSAETFGMVLKLLSTCPE